jgi:hypothetical protein
LYSVRPVLMLGRNERYIKNPVNVGVLQLHAPLISAEGMGKTTPKANHCLCDANQILLAHIG